MPDPSTIKARMNRLALVAKAQQEWRFTDKGKWELFFPRSVNNCKELRMRPKRISERVLTPSWQTKHWETDNHANFTELSCSPAKNQALAPIETPETLKRKKILAKMQLQTENSEYRAYYRNHFKAMTGSQSLPSLQSMPNSQSMPSSQSPKSHKEQKQCQKWFNSQVNAEWRFTDRGVYELYEPSSSQSLSSKSVRMRPQRLTKKTLDPEWKDKHRRNLSLSQPPVETNVLSSQEKLFLVRNAHTICPDPAPEIE